MQHSMWNSVKLRCMHPNRQTAKLPILALPFCMLHEVTAGPDPSKVTISPIPLCSPWNENQAHTLKVSAACLFVTGMLKQINTNNMWCSISHNRERRKHQWYTDHYGLWISLVQRFNREFSKIAEWSLRISLLTHAGLKSVSKPGPGLKRDFQGFILPSRVWLHV